MSPTTRPGEPRWVLESELLEAHARIEHLEAALREGRRLVQAMWGGTGEGPNGIAVDLRRALDPTEAPERGGDAEDISTLPS